MSDKSVFLRHPLSFADSEFRILFFSDIQDGPDYDRRTVAAMDAMIERHRPHLVLWGGDNVVNCSTAEEFTCTLKDFAAPMERRGIPWAHVFGNHDEELNPLSKAEQLKIYQSHPHCLTTTVPGIHGQSNFVLPVLSSDKKRIAFNVWGLDANQYIRELGQEIGYPDLEKDARLPHPLVRNCEYDLIRFDQLMWYYTTSQQMEQENGGRIPAVMLLHTCPEEFMAITHNPAETGMTGEHNEPICPAPINSGLFAAALQRGDVAGIFCGHDHINTYEGTFCGIRLSFLSCIGFGAYGLGGSDRENNRLRAGRLVTVKEEAPDRFSSQLLFAKDYL
ncbi:MAG: metallophosphoesterase [Oscillospiraceae bacterium]|nr:metallophosphoesterase [Oscillospiraceae bacterium]